MYDIIVLVQKRVGISRRYEKLKNAVMLLNASMSRAELFEKRSELEVLAATDLCIL